MRYTVIWTPAAEQNLATVWMAAHDRNAIESAASIVDQLLAHDPEAQGESSFRHCSLFRRLASRCGF